MSASKIPENKIVFAESDVIDQYDVIAAEFLNEIFNVASYMISDESDLNDFALCCLPDGISPDVSYEDAVELSRVVMCNRILQEYGIEVGPYDLLINVFERIRVSRIKPTLQ